jgi:hypothetical protein
LIAVDILSFLSLPVTDVGAICGVMFRLGA